MIREFIGDITERILSDGDIYLKDAEALLSIDGKDLECLFNNATKIREHFRGRKVSLCSITNAKSGNCPEDCAFCAQSNHRNTNAPGYTLISPEEMLKRAEEVIKYKTHRFCLVTSGCKLSEDELERICMGLRLIKNKFPELRLDASLGKISFEEATKLKEAGLTRYNHNLETCEEFFLKVCTTHTFSDRKKTIYNLKKAGLEVCCGGIFGLGESENQRLNFGFILKELDVDCIPINFLNPIPGTRLENAASLNPLEFLKMVAVYRFIHPKKEIKICGGREKNLGEIQPLIFQAGADSIIIGGYLTTNGNPAEKDLEMIKSLGLEV